MQPEEEVVYLYLDDIIPNRFQPREVFEEKPLKELAVSIKEHGVIQPIIVRKVKEKYEIIAGERRYKASALAGLTKIPAIIRDLDDKESSKIALLENLQRKNLNPIEEAKTYQKILEIDEMTQEELAKTMGKSQSAVANKLRLLSLPEEIQQALLEEKISERHARTFLNIKDPKQQQLLLQDVIDQKMTVRQLEDKIKEIQPQQVNFIPENGNDNTIQSIEPKDSISVSGQDNYVSNQPLVPDFISEEGENKQEPILISPSNNNLIENPDQSMENTESPENSGPKFIDFGNISNENIESNQDINQNKIEDETLSIDQTPINVDNVEEMKNNTIDIEQSQENNSGADLDNLLRINPNITETENNNNQNTGDFKFFSSAQEVLNANESDEAPSSSDYFQAPEIDNINVSEANLTSPTNNVSLSQANEDLIGASNTVPTIQLNNNNNNSLDDAVNLIKDAIKKAEEMGLKVDSDEMNLEKSYQVIIKIEKTE